MYFFFMLNWGLSGRIHFPRAPHLRLFTLVVDTNVRNSTMRCFYIYQRGQTIAVVCPFVLRLRGKQQIFEGFDAPKKFLKTLIRRSYTHIDLLR